MAPQQTEPPFLFPQLVVLALFIPLTIVAAGRVSGERAARVWTPLGLANVPVVLSEDLHPGLKG